MVTKHADDYSIWIYSYDCRRTIIEVDNMRNWENWKNAAAELTASELFELIRDAVVQGTVDAQTYSNTGRADLVRADLDKARGLPPIRQING